MIKLLLEAGAPQNFPVRRDLVAAPELDQRDVDLGRAFTHVHFELRPHGIEHDGPLAPMQLHVCGQRHVHVVEQVAEIRLHVHGRKRPHLTGAIQTDGPQIRRDNELPVRVPFVIPDDARAHLSGHQQGSNRQQKPANSVHEFLSTKTV